ncbi:MAG TPA: hypothetical protein VHW04_09260 [Solirubrobacteraceae bacterium]|nr:hypothetical protein [Solirubrobacteraceae bacterium]
MTERRAIRAAAATGLAVAALAVALAGCGLDVQQADLFLLTRTGQGPKLTLLPNDSGTISCDGGKARTLPDALLIEARDLAQDLDNDARRGLTIKPTPGTVFDYRIKLQHGTISFPDSAARTRKELSQATLFAAQAAQRACGLSG